MEIVDNIIINDVIISIIFYDNQMTIFSMIGFQ